ncbi:uncharacterized protein DUF3331 [Paraburkholderia sp. BL6669N2]|nr:uncharacterized protein DUF3331 [Paraburkholderia sp. BL6669N2]
MTRRIDPWRQTVLMLSRGPEHSESSGAFPEKNSRSSIRAPTSGTSRSLYVFVSFLERSTPSSVTLAWRDPTSCFYGEQIWRVADARVAGICALSGQLIVRGDRIYHPRQSKPQPANAGAMILESVLNLLMPSQDIEM